MSYDSLALLAAFHTAEGIRYPLLRDVDTRHFAAYGVLDPEYPPGHAWHGIALPGALFVTLDGTVQLKFAVPGYRQRPAMEEIYSALTDWLSVQADNPGVH
jgi:peroxiredoxin